MKTTSLKITVEFNTELNQIKLSEGDFWNLFKIDVSLQQIVPKFNFNFRVNNTIKSFKEGWIAEKGNSKVYLIRFNDNCFINGHEYIQIECISFKQ